MCKGLPWSPPKNNTSGYVGVCYHKHAKKWRSYINIDKKREYLGYFDTREKANRARLRREGDLGY